MRKKIKDFPLYEISDKGRIYRGNIEKTRRKIRDYWYVDLWKGNIRKNCRVARLVGIHFLKNPENKTQINHIDGNCLNDNVLNLEWATPSENQRHRIKLHKDKGTYKTPKGNLKMNRQDIEEIFKLFKEGYSRKEIAIKKKCGRSTVTHILLKTRRANQ